VRSGVGQTNRNHLDKALRNQTKRRTGGKKGQRDKNHFIKKDESGVRKGGGIKKKMDGEGGPLIRTDGNLFKAPIAARDKQRKRGGAGCT